MALENKDFTVDLYIRVSTERQAREGDSLEEQEAELKRFCEFRNFRIHQVYIEKGKSGGTTNRPEYQKLIRDIKSKKVNAVVVKKLDRLSRSLLDFENLMTIMQSHDVEFISIKESFDTTTAMGKAMLRVALVFAQLEREQTSERLVDVLDYRASQGLYNGGIRPYGYTNVNKELVPYKKEKDVLELIFKTFLETQSTTMVQNTLNESGFKNRNNNPWDKRAIEHILKNPVYIGKMRWKNAVYHGNHPPIISEADFQAVQDIFESRKYVRDSQKIRGLLKHVLVCSCGADMRPNYTKKKNGSLYYYYRCASTMNPAKKSPCGNKYLNMEATNDTVLEHLLVCTEEHYLTDMKGRIERHNHVIQTQLAALEDEVEGLDCQLQELKSKQEKYLDSLVTHRFTTQERQLINSKLEEFSLHEKQTRGALYKKRFEISQHTEKLLSEDTLKKALIYLKVNSKMLSNKELSEWLNAHVSKIIYVSEKEVGIRFALLDDLVG